MMAWRHIQPQQPSLLSKESQLLEPQAMQDGDIPRHQIFKIFSPSPKAFNTANVNVVSNYFLNKNVTSKNYSVDSPSSIFTQA